jgi:hypothetical protein
MPESCPICYDDYGKRNRKLKCQYCEVAACNKCHQTSIISTPDDPSCYSCKRAWTSDFIKANFTNAFCIGPLKKHCAQLLVDRERALLPAAQVYVEYKRQADEYRKQLDEKKRIIYAKDGIVSLRSAALQELHVIVSHIQACRNNIVKIKRDMKTVSESTSALLKTDLDNQRKKRDEYKEKEKTHREYFDTINAHFTAALTEVQLLHAQYNQYDDLYHNRVEGRVQEKREFIMKCPDGDCRGFLSSAYKCGTCAKWACQACLVVLGEKKDVEHTCDPGLVESTKLIRSETRPCPKCAAPIFKIDGCDQMFCVVEKCGTAFSWNTGHIVSGVIHNPHYYEWLRKTGGGAVEREIGDIPCGGMPQVGQFVRLFTRVELIKYATEYMLESFRNMTELIAVRLPMYPARRPNMMNKDADVCYLTNIIDEKEWRARLQRSDALFRRKREIGQILQTMATTFSDRINGVYSRLREFYIAEEGNTDTEDILNEWLIRAVIPELEQLRAFGNECFVNLSKRDKMAVPQFEKYWKWRGARILHRPPSKAAAAAAAAAAPEVTAIVST